ncbi:MAG: 50S ribosomal protein L9 [Candidatus Paceibacterota bacterium]
MQVILLQDIETLGKKFDIKQVKDGYARNFLIPRKLVKVADSAAIKQLEAQKAKIEQQEQEFKAKAEKLAKDLKDQKFDFYVKTGKKKEVFGSINKEDIKKSLAEKGIEAEILLDKPFKALGEYKVEIDLGRGIKTKIDITLHSQP